jgi:hypothetical protein
MNRLMKAANEMLSEAHSRFGTFIYGALGEPPVITHTDARNDYGIAPVQTMPVNPAERLPPLC